MFSMTNYARECIRVLNVASRPRRKDFEKIVQITGLGIILIGLIGVIISFVLSLV
ncbi:MAG: protein translocase SEC61 complex subunit gamma [Candidatus Micrarchaeia archaeon]